MREVSKLKCEKSLAEFIKAAWHIIEPGQKYVHGWHIDFICYHLEAVTNGVKFEDDSYYNRLLVNVPPGPGWVENMVVTDRGRIRLGDIKPGDRVLTHAGRFMPVSACYSKGMLETLRVETRSGREMYLTPDHNVLTPDGWIEAGELKIGSVLGVVTPTSGISEDRIGPEEARLLGYLIGDGSVTQATAMFTNNDEDTAEDFVVCAKAMGFGVSHGKKGAIRLLGGAKVHAWLDRHNIRGCNSYQKFIPEAVLCSSNEIIRNFIGAYWSCDGMMEVRATQARGSSYRSSATTVSERLAGDIMHALTRIGIRSVLRKKARTLETKAQPGGVYRSFNIEVYSEADTARFIDMPGLSKRKNALAKMCSARRFDTTLMEDPVVSIEPSGMRECMCISVDGDHSLTWSDIAVHNTMKSLIIGVFWPAWEWGPRNMPHMRYVCASHSQDLAIRDSLRMRRLVTSEWYQGFWGDRVEMTKDQNAKGKFENMATGSRQACAFEGITGYRGDRVIIDDPHSVEDANSDAKRASTTRLFKEAVLSRLNNPDQSAIIVIMQRLHEADLSGVITNEIGGYDHIMLPMRFEVERACTTMLGMADPRTEEGDLLFPERFPLYVVDRDEQGMGPYATAGQNQQKPEPRGGGIIKDYWWKPWTLAEYPKMEYVVASLDSAYTEKSENDPSAISVWGVYHGGAPEGYLNTRMVDRYGRPIDANRSFERPGLGSSPKAMMMYAWQGRLELHDLVEKTVEICRMMQVNVLLIENKATGLTVAQELRRLFADEDFAVQMYDPMSLDKTARLYSVQHLFSEGLIHTPSKQWAEMVIRQVSSFPNGTHDDLVDTVSMSLRHIRNIGMLQRPQEIQSGLDNSSMHRGAAPPPLYGGV